MRNNNNDFGFDDDAGLNSEFKRINRNIEDSHAVEEKTISNKSEIETVNKQIRLSRKDINTLTAHFKNKGLKFSTGVRMILVQYIKENSLD